MVLTETSRAAIAFTRAEAGGERHRRQGLLVALGDPVGVASEQVAAIWRLRDLALEEGRDPVFWQVGAELLHLYEDLGLSVWPIGPARFLCCAPERAAAVFRALEQHPGDRDWPAVLGRLAPG